MNDRPTGSKGERQPGAEQGSQVPHRQPADQALPHPVDVDLPDAAEIATSLDRPNEAGSEPRVVVSCEEAAWQEAFPDAMGFLGDVARQAVLGSGRASSAGPDEVSLVLSGDAQQQELNRRWRGYDSPTNVLSFPDGTALADGGRLLGDVVLALETLQREAVAQNKSLRDHSAHLVVHGVLHLLGFDHEEAGQAALMEGLEVQLLATLNIADPYAEEAEVPPLDRGHL
ncbi:MAG TPA: rRNA maturation RNase YbeY [Kiloniellales bacterium]|nr:rRNA maturation RNase YbeY [Kiloniellales bacterium]